MSNEKRLDIQKYIDELPELEKIIKEIEKEQEKENNNGKKANK